MFTGYLQFKPKLFDAEYNINAVNSLIGNNHQKCDLLVMPELANSGYLFSGAQEAFDASEKIPDGKFCTNLFNLAEKYNTNIVSGINERAGDKLYNSAVLVTPAGDCFVYRKTHLFLEEKLWFTPGDTGLNVFEINGDFGKVKTGIMICFDWIFPEAARTLALKGAQVITHPSNLVLQYCQKAMFARAVENRVFTITANRTGRETNSGKELFFTGSSVIVDPKGNYLSSAGESDELISVVEIDPSLALDKNVTTMNDIIKDRRTDLYNL